ncbi:response regulator [Candidatus Parabeggiatoa sp. HSG14]|uniref:response regulator n=1 Tax=Candidatus Parabeggiatoa sp. HSG14 TaxID=3055593 RepID=UPI0025A6C0D8|nr:response regulator [Thiotrichales bacterium HSG14]
MKKFAILCIDDEPLILNSLKTELKEILEEEYISKEYIIELAENGEEALEIVEELLEDNIEIPLVISDCIMPQMRGDDLLQRIHAMTTKTLQIMLTGQASAEAIGNAINKAKLYRYIAKPWDREDLKLTIIEAIRSYFQDKQLTEQNTKLEQLNLEQAALIKAYERFVPHPFLNLLEKNSILDMNLGDQVEKEMTILFTDIRGFTHLSETLTPHDNFEFLNSYLGQMEPIIIENQGIIDKYIGDAIMALFIRADDAVNAGIAMQKRLAKYNKILKTAGFLPIQIGIGINTGPLMLGIIGGQERMEGTVIADAVNVSSRVESLTKNYNSPLLITENTYQKLEKTPQHFIRVMDCVTVKGKTEPVTIYEVFEAESSTIQQLKSTTLHDFEQGFKHFHNEQFAEAQLCFKKVLQINENDIAAQIYLENCSKVLSMTTSETPKILIVDDIPANLKLLFNILNTNHFKTIVAKDGKTALKAAELRHPQLILLDVMMPNMDGFEVCQKLKENMKTQNIPVIFMTALSDTINKVKGLELGAVDYITKPFEEKEILSRIKIHLKLHYLQQKIQAKNVELEIHNLQLKERIKTLTVQTNPHVE